MSNEPITPCSCITANNRAVCVGWCKADTPKTCGETKWGVLRPLHGQYERRCALPAFHSAQQLHTDGEVRW